MRISWILMIAVLAMSTAAGAGAADQLGPCADETQALGAVDSTETVETCIDLYCEWVPKCQDLGGGWSDHWQEERCLTNCGYVWYWTGNKCCWYTAAYPC